MGPGPERLFWIRVKAKKISNHDSFELKRSNLQNASPVIHAPPWNVIKISLRPKICLTSQKFQPINLRRFGQKRIQNKAVLRIRIRIRIRRIHILMGLLDPDPDPSIIKQK